MNTRSLGAYLLSTLAVVAAAWLVQPSSSLIGWYWCITFWGLVAADALLVEANEQAVPSRWSFVDRFLGYLFVAPFIWPARLYTLLRRF